MFLPSVLSLSLSRSLILLSPSFAVFFALTLCLSLVSFSLFSKIHKCNHQRRMIEKNVDDAIESSLSLSRARFFFLLTQSRNEYTRQNERTCRSSVTQGFTLSLLLTLNSCSKLAVIVLNEILLPFSKQYVCVFFSSLLSLSFLFFFFVGLSPRLHMHFLLFFLIQSAVQIHIYEAE